MTQKKYLAKNYFRISPSTINDIILQHIIIMTMQLRFTVAGIIF